MSWISWVFDDTNHVVALATLVLAIAAVAQFELMRRTAQRQLRAYVFPESTGITDGMALNPPQPNRANEPGIFLLIRNTGNTPAFQVKSFAQIDVVEPRHEHTLVPPTPLVHGYPTPLPPNGTVTKGLWFGRPLNAQEIADVTNGAKAIYVYGRVEYLDTFKQKRFTNFRLAYSGAFPAQPGAIFLFAQTGNDAN